MEQYNVDSVDRINRRNKLDRKVTLNGPGCYRLAKIMLPGVMEKLEDALQDLPEDEIGAADAILTGAIEHLMLEKFDGKVLAKPVVEPEKKQVKKPKPFDQINWKAYPVATARRDLDYQCRKCFDSIKIGQRYRGTTGQYAHESHFEEANGK
jgi:hypothetical protein